MNQMSAYFINDTQQEVLPRLELSVEALNLLNTYLDEVIHEEDLSHAAQIILRRVATPVCALADSIEDLFIYEDHPARKILDTTVKIAKLCGDNFGPGEALYQTVSESIKDLRSKRVNRHNTLVRLQGDLDSVFRLALIRVPAATREEAKHAGTVSSAKIIAALMVVGHGQRFDAGYKLLYFALTEWFELVVVTILQCGADSEPVKELSRLTFTLFYLDSGRAAEKHRIFMQYLLPKLDELIST
ncbi:MAG: hypothetical protein KTR16_15365, partial [Acidiferrobacterales bacterium]|nr:hypothetical protein [Acidiferrobacterales bacterium]